MSTWRAVVRAAFVALLVVSGPAEAKQHRSKAALRQFQIEHPCPSTGRQYGPCPGWIKDHITALKCGGADAPANLQWQTVEDAKAKDQWELKGCK